MGRLTEWLQTRWAHRGQNGYALKAALARLMELDRALTEHVAQLEAVMEAAFVGIIVADQDGIIVRCNDEATRLFKYDRSMQLIGRPLTVLMPERYRAAHSVALRLLVARHPARLLGRILPLEGLCQDGSEFPLDISLGMGKVRTAAYFVGFLRRREEGIHGVK